MNSESEQAHTRTRLMVANALLDSTANAVVVADKGGLITLWNPGATRLFGFTEQEAIGNTLDIIIPERQRERHWSAYHESMRTGTTRYGAGDTLAVPAMRKDGTRISIEFTIVLCREKNDEVAGIVATIRDVTERFNELRALRKAATIG